MKKTVRIFSLLLIAVLFCSLAAMPAKAALTEEAAAAKGAEVFEAWNILEYSSYEYMSKKYASPYRLEVDARKDDIVWNGLLAAWRVTTFDLKSEFTYAQKEVGYYDTFLFNILYDSSSESLGTSFISTMADGTGDMEKAWKSIGASTWKKVSSVVEDLSGNTPIDLKDTEKASKFLSALKTSGDLKNTFTVLGDVTEYLGYCSTALDLIEKLSKIEAILQNTMETGEVLSDLYQRCSDNPAMKEALNNYSQIVSGALSKAEIVALFTGETTVNELSKKAASIVWKAATSAYSIPAAGQAVGKFSADTLFGTSSMINNYYKIYAMYQFEDMVKAETLACENAFRSNPTPETAKKFIASFKLLYKTYLEGLECTKSYLKATKEEGALNKLFHHSKESDYEQMVKSINSIKSSIQITLDYIDTNSYNFYLDVLSTMDEADGTSIVQDAQLETLPETVTESACEIALCAVQENVFRFSDPVIETDTTLTEDLETYGNYTLKSGKLDLNGHTLTVRGDLTLSGGTLDLNGGTLVVYGDAYMASNASLRYGTLQIDGTLWQSAGNLTVNKGQLLIAGDYRFQTIAANSAGDTIYNASYGSLIMQYDEDLVRVGGDYITQSTSGSTLTAGTLELAGDLQQLVCTTDSRYYNFAASGTHTVILNGTKQQNLHFCHTSNGFATLKVSNSTGIAWSGYLNIGNPESDFSVVASDLTIASLNLNGHTISLDGDVLITGNIDLAYGTMQVSGTLWQTAGTVTVNKGQLLIGGDYRFQTIAANSAGDIVYKNCYGSLIMQYDEDLVRVGGDYITQSTSGSTLTAGTMELAGDLQQLVCSNDSRYYNFAALGTHKVVLNGTAQQNIHFCHSNNGFASLQVTNSAGIAWSGYLNISNPESDFSITSSDLNIISLNLKGHTLTFNGDVLVTGDVNLAYGTMEVNGTLWQTGGTISINKGQLLITGDYRFQTVSTTSAGDTVYGSCWASLIMQYDEDLVRVGGDYITQSTSGSTLTAGTMELAGDLQQLECNADNRYFNFAALGTHKVVLNGTKQQNIHFCHSNNGFASLQVTNSAGIAWSGYLNIGNPESDFSITASDLNIISMNLKGHTLTFNGDVLVTGNVNLAYGTMQINGNLRQCGGSININKGKLLISGNYCIQDISTNDTGDVIYMNCWGSLNMCYNEDLVRIGGSFITRSLSESALSAGTMEIAGDFQQLECNYDNRYFNFAASGTHTVILNGTEPQNVYFCNSSCGFQYLKLTQDGTNYTFNPDPCWKNLIEIPTISDVEVTGISLSARTHTMTVGQTFQLMATVHPSDATDPSLTWTSSDERVATVTQDGLVTALAEGSAVITATASNGLYRTCAVTVNKITSGVLTAGTVSALPGNTLSVPVTVWDNPGFAALRVTVEYDDALLTFTGVTAGEVLAGGDLTAEADGGTCNVLWYDTADTEANGTLFTLEFQVSESAALGSRSDMSLSYRTGDICTAGHVNVDFFTEDGAVLVRDIQKGDIYEDGTVDAHDILLLQQYLTGLADFSVREKAAADLDGSGAVDMKDIVLLAQQLVAVSGSSLALADTDRSLVIRVEDAIFREDGYADVPVTFSGCGGIAAFRFQVDYDDTLLELTAIESADTLGDRFRSNLEDADRTSTLVTWYDAEDQTLEGTVLTLRFRLKDEGFRGLLPVSLSCPGADLCTSSLEDLPAELTYGVLRTPDYTQDVQASAPTVHLEGGTGVLTARVTCADSLSGEAVHVLAAFYGEDNRLLTVWNTAAYRLENGTLELRGTLPAYQTVKLFLLSEGSLAPLCENTHT